jgi:hypothetical protein
MWRGRWTAPVASSSGPAANGEIAASAVDPDMTTVNFPEWHFRAASAAAGRRQSTAGNRKKPAEN